MTNDDRRILEDRIYHYGTAVRDGSLLQPRYRKGVEDVAWSRVMNEMTRIQRKEENHG